MKVNLTKEKDSKTVLFPLSINSKLSYITVHHSTVFALYLFKMNVTILLLFLKIIKHVDDQDDIQNQSDTQNNDDGRIMLFLILTLFRRTES